MGGQESVSIFIVADSSSYALVLCARSCFSCQLLPGLQPSQEIIVTVVIRNIPSILECILAAESLVLGSKN